MKRLNFITWARWRLYDPYDNRYFTTFTASILRPSFQFPVACASMSIVNGGGRVFIRFASLTDLFKAFVVPAEYIDRLKTAYAQAILDANQIQEQQKVLHKMSNLTPGSQVVRTDTGEIIAEIERDLKDNQ